MRPFLALAALLLAGCASQPVAQPDPRLFEMRVYYAEPGKLDALHARFRDHTCALFERHGMTNLPYWVMDADQRGARSNLIPGRTLVYLLAHRDEAAARASFAAFRADPAWVRAKADSEAAAGGPLTVPDGVKGEFLVPTDYSRVK